MNTLTDVQLIEYHQKGNKHAYLEICNRYAGLIFNQTSRIGSRLNNHSIVDYEDIGQEIHCALLTVLKNINVSKIKNRKDYKLALSFQNSIKNYRNSLNKLIAEQNRRHIPIMETFEVDFIQEVKDNKRYDDFDNIKKIIKDFRETLNDRELKIFDMFYKGNNRTEISRKMNISKQAVSYWMRRLKYKYKKSVGI